MIIQIFRFKNFIYKTISANKFESEITARSISINRNQIIQNSEDPSFSAFNTNYHCTLCEQGIRHSNCTDNRGLNEKEKSR